ncbi:type II toxin-antitoxin system CcdA family antitoxin [Rhizobium rosettiformans]|uniref:Post-segregation antitoxin CcdA n=2 Tax=Rhizobium rosettiformans TaxID=1368430 RepID=A0A4S8PYG5_9HYPH|nr:type II toxin-antitoxin system CcdA family antitoxin [Rhizobium rosettiformans]MBB5276061.1 antitoxin CcdA [Rhizobium rosettiformans]MDR7028156.1 antitoxin CcdA [Rhizobium rosettiformans]MDR7064562.1 antitoxin CcdA [Rhizobium rosettiformans]THV36708.1 post-segregation antitoxin CcdA [Rhizobium rosettiformans W3]
MSIEARKPQDLTVSEALVAEAAELGLDITSAAEQGIARAIKAEKERRWKIENADAIKASNDYVAKHGLPLAKYRTF